MTLITAKKLISIIFTLYLFKLLEMNIIFILNSPSYKNINKESWFWIVNNSLITPSFRKFIVLATSQFKQEIPYHVESRGLRINPVAGWCRGCRLPERLLERVVRQCANERASAVTPSVTVDTPPPVAVQPPATHTALNVLAALPDLPNKFWSNKHPGSSAAKRIVIFPSGDISLQCLAYLYQCDVQVNISPRYSFFSGAKWPELRSSS